MEYTFEEQPILKSITDINGNEWNATQVSTYNTYTESINATANRSLASGSLALAEREAWLNRRHQYYVTITALLNP